MADVLSSESVNYDNYVVKDTVTDVLCSESVNHDNYVMEDTVTDVLMKDQNVDMPRSETVINMPTKYPEVIYHEFKVKGGLYWDGISNVALVGMLFQTKNCVKGFMKIYGRKSQSKYIVSMGGISDDSRSKQVK